VLANGEALYRYDGQAFPPSRDTGPAPECRLEISPATSSTADLFLHVLTATDNGVNAVPRAVATMEAGRVRMTLAEVELIFNIEELGGEITCPGQPAVAFPQ
jgi:hypothetical protein